MAETCAGTTGLLDSPQGRIQQVIDLFHACMIDTRDAYELLNGHLDGAPPAGIYYEPPDEDDSLGQLADIHEDLLIVAAQAGLMVAANPLINLRRVIGKCRAVENPTEQLVDLLGHCECMIAAAGSGCDDPVNR
jgi:hypothetical protein